MGNMVTVAVKINDIDELRKNKKDLDLRDLMHFQDNEPFKEFVSGIAVSSYRHADDNANIFVSDKGLKIQDYAYGSVSAFVKENLNNGKTVSEIVPNILLGDYKKDLSFNNLSAKDENDSKIAVFGILTDHITSHLKNENFIDELIEMSLELAKKPLTKDEAVITGSLHNATPTSGSIALLGVLDEKSNGIVNMYRNTFTHIPVPAKHFDLTKEIKEFKASIKKEFNLKTRKPTLKP